MPESKEVAPATVHGRGLRIPLVPECPGCGCCWCRRPLSYVVLMLYSASGVLRRIGITGGSPGSGNRGVSENAPVLARLFRRRGRQKDRPAVVAAFGGDEDSCERSNEQVSERSEIDVTLEALGVGRLEMVRASDLPKFDMPSADTDPGVP
jgi:hypothetical protein